MINLNVALQLQACVYECLYRNKAIADYLNASGYTSTLAEFQKETNLVCSSFFSVSGVFSLVEAEFLRVSNELIGWVWVAGWVMILFFSAQLLRNYKMLEVKIWRASGVW